MLSCSIDTLIKGTVSERFFSPLATLWPKVTEQRKCSAFSDWEFIVLGISRVLSQAQSGRDFLQSYADGGGKDVAVSLFFETLRSERRLDVCAQANHLLLAEVSRCTKDPFNAFKEFNDYDLYAGDGHSIKASAHDPVIGNDKRAVSNFYILNLRSRALQHFELALTDAAAARKGEHDMHAIKRRGLDSLRFGAPKGRKVMIVWDRAGIDFRHWHKAKESGVYFVSREKDNMALEVVGKLAFDKSNPCNDGVRSDELVATSTGVTVRRVIYWDVVTETEFVYLSSNLKIPPGMLALLYKRRWDIEKVFDETENRFQESQAWAKSATAKRIQAQMICLTHNLCLIMEEVLSIEEQVRNEPELERRKTRTESLAKKLAAKGLKLPFVYWAIDRLTQRGVKLIRWIRTHLNRAQDWKRAVDGLRRAYATW